MPPSESMRWAEYGAADEVDDYIVSRRARRAAASADLLSIDAEFTWDTAASTRPLSSGIGRDERSPRRATPSVVRGELLEEPSGDAWRARLDQGDPGGSGPPAGRRTVVITGRGAERYPGPRRSYSASLRPHERAGFRPDRIAMWAFLLAVALMLVAVLAPH